MRHGFIKVAAGTPELKVADCGYNTQAILNVMERAMLQQARILVLPELCITGYTCGDLFFHQPLIKAAEQALISLIEKSAGTSMITILGLPLQVGCKLYDCAAIIQNGSLLGVVPKTHLPNYGAFCEQRYFAPAPLESTVINIGEYRDVAFGADILFQCEQMQELCFGVEIGEDLLAPMPCSTELALKGATLICNLSARPALVEDAEYIRTLVKAQSSRLNCAYVYANAGAGESTSDVVYGGKNIIAENGAILFESERFSAELAFTEVDLQKVIHERMHKNTFHAKQDRLTRKQITFSLPYKDTVLTRPFPMFPFIPHREEEIASRCAEILSIQAYGLKKRLEHSGCKTVVVGVSGGLDSTLAILVCAKTMDLLSRPHSDIVAVTMPCFGTTKRTRSNAERLCDHLHIPCKEVDITKAVQQHFIDIQQDPEKYDVTFENSQARERTQVLMDIANQTGGLVIGTGDLSELALGWATYNGDHMSMYGVNASVPKTLIRYIVQYAADTAAETGLRNVLLDILNTPVSPELLPADSEGEISQKTEHIVGPYELHDFFLYWMVRWSMAPDKIFRIAKQAFSTAYDEDTIRKWLTIFIRRFFTQQFKRSCLPEGPKVGSISFSPRGDWHMPGDASAIQWLNW